MMIFADYGLYVDAGQRGRDGSVQSPFTVVGGGSTFQRGNVRTFTPGSDSFTADGGRIVLTLSLIHI